jgi:hypothetical protein
MKAIKIKNTSIWAIIPFVLFSVSWLLGEVNIDNMITFAFSAGSIVSFLVLLCIGWVKNFPKWTTHAVGVSIIMSLYFMDISCPMLNRNEVWGFLGLIPLVLTLLIAFLIRPSFQPLKELYKQIKEDKSILLFLFYGVFPLLLAMAFDEMHNSFVLISYILFTVMIITSTLLYLENKIKISKMLTLLLGVSIPIIIVIVLIGITIARVMS